MDKEKNYFPNKVARASLAKCKMLLKVASSCRELNDMAGYADALGDIGEELNKYSPDIASCGMPISDAQVVEYTRMDRDQRSLDDSMENLSARIMSFEKLLGICFLSSLMPKA